MPSKASCLLLFVCFAGALSAQSVPNSKHVWMITEENHSYEDVVGNSNMPYYNRLIQRYGLATQYYSDRHSSLPALMWLVAGASVETNNDTTSCQHTHDNVVRELLKQGYSWRSYQQAMPYAGYQALKSPDGLYYRRHNPLIDFTDVCPGTGQDIMSVPYTQMAADFSDGTTVNYAYIVPDTNEDAHNGTLAAADQWLQTNVPTILARPEFNTGGDGILFIAWDEGNLSTDNRCSATVSTGCGGRVATLVIGPHVKQGYRSTITYHHENLLKTVCVAMGLSTCPGKAANVAPMADFFSTGTSSTPTDSVVISTPSNGDTIDGAVHLLASASESQAVSQTQVWDNGIKLGVYGTDIDVIYNLTPGSHTTDVMDLDSKFQLLHQATVSYNVEALVDAVQIISPSPGETVNTTAVHVVAQASESVTVTQMQVWDNGFKLGDYAGTSVDQYYSLAPGSHTLTVFDLDANYNTLHKTSVAYSVQ